MTDAQVANETVRALTQGSGSAQVAAMVVRALTQAPKVDSDSATLTEASNLKYLDFDSIALTDVSNNPGNVDPLASMTGIYARYVGADLVSLPDGAGIATWPDHSGHGRDMVQATSGNQPTKQTVTNNGQTFPAGLFGTGGSKWLQLNSVNLGPDMTLVAVVKTTGSSTYHMVLQSSGSLGTAWFQFRTPNNTTMGTVVWNTGNSALQANAAATITNWNAFVGRADSAGGKIKTKVNGGTDGTVNISGTLRSNVNQPIQMGTYNNGNYNLVGYIAELIIFDHALTDADVAKVDSYIQDTYGITVADYVAPPTTTSDTDTATVSEASGLTAHVSDTDSITLADTGSPTSTGASKSDTDSAVLNETESVQSVNALSDTDSAAVSELSDVVALIRDTDAITLAEDHLVIALLGTVDSLSLTETVYLGGQVAGSDGFSLADASLLTLAVFDTDDITLTEAQDTTALLTEADSAALTEVYRRSFLNGRDITVTAAAQPSAHSATVSKAVRTAESSVSWSASVDGS